VKAVDGIIGQNDNGEWASLGEVNPWIQLDWTSARTVDRIRLYDRPNLSDSANGGTLSFSDGSSIPVSGIANNGTVKDVTFAARSITWVRFQVAGGSGANVGLSEFQVYGAPGPTSTPTITASATTGGSGASISVPSSSDSLAAGRMPSALLSGTAGTVGGRRTGRSTRDSS
jgi:hypothetical protein